MEKPDKIEYRIFYITTTLVAFAFAVTFCIELGAERYLNTVIAFVLFYTAVAFMSYVEKREKHER